MAKEINALCVVLIVCLMCVKRPKVPSIINLILINGNCLMPSILIFGIACH